MFRRIRKRWSIAVAAWVAVGVVGQILDLWEGLSLVSKRMSTITTIGEAALPHIISAGTVIVLGMFGTLLAYGLIRFVPRARYYLNDGPKVERFRDLASTLKKCRNNMVRHYENRGAAFVGPLPVITEGAAISADFNGLFIELRSLNIPVIEAKRYRDDTPRGKRFWVAYLTDMEKLARRGDLKSARSPNRPHLTWHSGNVVEGDIEPDARKRNGQRRQP